MTKKGKIRIQILSLLNELEASERIDLIESIGKRLRQQNSIESAKEVRDFMRKAGTRKDIDYSPVLRKEK